MKAFHFTNLLWSTSVLENTMKMFKNIWLPKSKKYGYKNNISEQYNSYMWKEITIGKDLLHAHDHEKEKTRNFNKLNKNIGTCTRYLTFYNKINLWLLTQL